MGRLRTALTVAAVVGGVVLVDLVLAGDAPLPRDTDHQVLVVRSTFDHGTDGWQALGPADVRRTDNAARAGEGSLLVVDRSEPWNGAQLDITDLVVPDRTYRVSVWARLAPDAEPADLQLTVERSAGGTQHFDHLVRRTVTSREWVELGAQYTMPAGTGQARLYLESLDSVADLLLDEVRVSHEAPPIQEDLPALRDVLADRFDVGVAVGPQDLAGPSGLLVRRHFGAVTPENAMKPAWIQPLEGELSFEASDQVTDFAVIHGLDVHGHTLVWHRSTPDWFFTGPDGQDLTSSPQDQELLLSRLETHTRAVAEHLRERYGDDDPVRSWDVVNEAIDPTQPDGLRRSRWYDVLGPDYLAHAFRIADEAFPEAALFLNDYDTDYPGKRRAMAQVVQDLLDQGVPIDGVGHQLHVNLDRPVERIGQTLDELASLGVRQAVTELDVALAAPGRPGSGLPTPELLEEQAAYYGQVMDLLVARSADIDTVSVWGVHDGRSWLRTWRESRRLEAPLLFDDELQAKPAFWAVVESAREAR
ncbi:endo-1,4-beta-xylanase [Actinotalea sp. K2]|uniref:endo-1,4-beta-xylanase n=1 Tax=Actinotalea sp. K2 TaxID=2939438 RepID=UPI0020175547|nr:endo-1,4-beta-xylanase [Actinotalea sp. K2]MCL3862450.1 endo-1,4-beta-xylanase [Actinotalea sp. K2]